MKMIIMVGGAGTRLWPLSRTYYPKQFLRLPGMDKSIFQMTIERCLLMGDMEDIYIVTSKNYSNFIQEQIKEHGRVIPQDQILLEPEAKNTLPAILYAVQAIREKCDDICAVFASDHVIDHPQILADTILGAVKLAEQGFVCFGITPTSPETGFGYIKPGDPVEGGFVIAEFKEKPNHETACQFVKEGYLWNSGMFIFQTEQFDSAVKKYNPEVYDAFRAETVEEKFRATPSISVDYGLIEKMELVYGAPMKMDWNDIGNFSTLYDRYKSKKDEEGNISFGDEIMLDSTNNLVISENAKVVALVGVSDLVVVDQEDALLICKKDSSAKVKDVVDILKNKKDKRI